MDRGLSGHERVEFEHLATQTALRQWDPQSIVG